MLNTQRLSSLAFNLRDGREADESKLTDSMKRLAIKYSTLKFSLTFATLIVLCFRSLY